MKDLRSKIQELLTEQSKKNTFWKRHSKKADANELLLILHPQYYPKLMNSLSDDDLRQAMSVFKTFGETEIMFSSVDSVYKFFWLVRAVDDLQILDLLPDEELSKGLNNVDAGILVDLFSADEISGEQQTRIIYLLGKDQLETWIKYREITELVSYLEWLCNAEVAQKVEIFNKIASLSEFSIAKLLEDGNEDLMQTILAYLDPNQKREVLQAIRPEKLYEVLEKNSFSMLTDCPSKELFAFVYERLPEEDQQKFFRYMDEIMGMYSFFSPVIIAEHYRNLDDLGKDVLLERIFYKKGLKEFDDLCQRLSVGEKVETYQMLLNSENEQIRAIIKTFLEEKDSLDFAEQLILSYVTQK